MLYSGIDLHKRTCSIATLDARGNVVDQARMATDRVALASYFRQHPEPHTAVVEATGSWYWLHDFLQAQGIALVLAHAKYLKAIAYAKVKTDAIDALTLARLLRVQLIPEAHMVSPEIRPLRDLLRARLLLVQKRVSTRNSTQRLLEKYNVPAVEQLPPLVQFHAACFQEHPLHECLHVTSSVRPDPAIPRRSRDAPVVRRAPGSGGSDSVAGGGTAGGRRSVAARVLGDAGNGGQLLDGTRRQLDLVVADTAAAAEEVDDGFGVHVAIQGGQVARMATMRSSWSMCSRAAKKMMKSNVSPAKRVWTSVALARRSSTTSAYASQRTCAA